MSWKCELSSWSRLAWRVIGGGLEVGVGERDTIIRRNKYSFWFETRVRWNVEFTSIKQEAPALHQLHATMKFNLVQVDCASREEGNSALS